MHYYHFGKDFAEITGVRTDTRMEPLYSDNIDKYLSTFGSREWDRTDFRKFSRVLNPDWQQYDFNLKGLISAADLTEQ